jgi:serine/threonine protein kinase
MEQYQHEEEATNIPEKTYDISKYNHRNIIASKYVFEKKIGKGSFGCIYRGLNIITQEKVAIKYEATTCAQPTLLWESKILNHLSGIPGVVKLRYFGTESNKNIIVMDLFSHTLAEEVAMLKKEAKIGNENSDNNSSAGSSSNSGNGSECCISDSEHERSYSDEMSDAQHQYENIYYRYYINDVLKYMISIVEIIEKIHEKGVIHRDIKPENFMIAQAQAQLHDHNPVKKLHIIDFGLSRIYIKDGAHIPNKPNSSIVGTMRYISTYIHEGNVYSRRDDIISILYVIIYLLKGRLPWCGLKTSAGDKRTKAEIVYEMKKITPIPMLCNGLPAIFERMLTYAYKIEFDEKPDYIYLKRLCKKELGSV